MLLYYYTTFKFTLENYSIEDSQNGFDIMDGEAFQNSLIDRVCMLLNYNTYFYGN